jgi:capsular polysaccharide biosynthesis protein
MRSATTGRPKDSARRPSTSSWIPAYGDGGIVKPFSYGETKTVEIAQAKEDQVEEKLRASWIGRIYTNRLRRYLAVHRIVGWMWRNGYPLYIEYIDARLFDRAFKGWRRLIRLREFVRENGIPIHTLAEAATVETPQPRIFPARAQNLLVSPHDWYEFPEVFVANAGNAIVYGRSNLVLTDRGVICHDLYNFINDYTYEEFHWLTMINPKSNRIRWLLHDKTPELIPVVATFVDACASNYAHWITEVLPRVVLFCADERFKDVPIVVDAGLHSNIMESLLLAAGPDREIITLPVGRALAVDRLYVTSVAGYVPFEQRKPMLTGHSHGMFSPRAFEAMRARMISIAQPSGYADYPKRIFIRRNSDIRNVINADEVEQLMVSRGFSIVEPEKLTFIDQVRLFTNAEVVVGSSGAAFGNIVFCPPTTEIYIFRIKNPNKVINWYWQNIACASGKTVNYVFGERTPGDPKGIHADRVISLDDLAQAVGNR